MSAHCWQHYLQLLHLSHPCPRGSLRRSLRRRCTAACAAACTTACAAACAAVCAATTAATSTTGTPPPRSAGGAHAKSLLFFGGGGGAGYPHSICLSMERAGPAAALGWRTEHRVATNHEVKRIASCVRASWFCAIACVRTCSVETHGQRRLGSPVSGR